MARPEFTRLAEADLDEIGEYIAQDDPAAAIRLISFIRDACGRIAIAPRLGRRRPELAPEIRSFTVSPYVIFYKVTAGELVLITRILHRARDLHRVHPN